MQSRLLVDDFNEYIIPLQDEVETHLFQFKHVFGLEVISNIHNLVLGLIIATLIYLEKNIKEQDFSTSSFYLESWYAELVEDITMCFYRKESKINLIDGITYFFKNTDYLMLFLITFNIGFLLPQTNSSEGRTKEIDLSALTVREQKFWNTIHKLTQDNDSPNYFERTIAMLNQLIVVLSDDLVMPAEAVQNLLDWSNRTREKVEALQLNTDIDAPEL